MAVHITVADDDDRPPPGWYVPDFAAARQRAERELARQGHGLFPSLRRKHHR